PSSAHAVLAFTDPLAFTIDPPDNDVGAGFFYVKKVPARTANSHKTDTALPRAVGTHLPAKQKGGWKQTCSKQPPIFHFHGKSLHAPPQNLPNATAQCCHSENRTPAWRIISQNTHP